MRTGPADALERARELAEADIEARGGGLALQVLSGDRFALARAVELARIQGLASDSKKIDIDATGIGVSVRLKLSEPAE